MTTTNLAALTERLNEHGYPFQMSLMGGDVRNPIWSPILVAGSLHVLISDFGGEYGVYLYQEDNDNPVLAHESIPNEWTVISVALQFARLITEHGY